MRKRECNKRVAKGKFHPLLCCGPGEKKKRRWGIQEKPSIRDGPYSAFDRKTAEPVKSRLKPDGFSGFYQQHRRGSNVKDFARSQECPASFIVLHISVFFAVFNCDCNGKGASSPEADTTHKHHNNCTCTHLTYLLLGNPG